MANLQTNLTQTQIAVKRLSGKAMTNINSTVAQEKIGSTVQTAAGSVFAEKIPASPNSASGMLNLIQSESNSHPGTVQLVMFEITGSGVEYQNTVATDAGSVGLSGTGNADEGETSVFTYHAYALRLTGSYQADNTAVSSNFNTNASTATNIGTFPYSNDAHLSGSIGKLQIIPEYLGTKPATTPNPYEITLLAKDGSVISPGADIDWYIDQYSGMLFIQDPVDYEGVGSQNLIPAKLRAFIYVGKFQDEMSYGDTVDLHISASAGTGFSLANAATASFESGSAGVTVTAGSTNKITIGANTDNVTFNNITASANISSSGHVEGVGFIASSSNGTNTVPTGFVFRDPNTPTDLLNNRITLTSARNMQFRAGGGFQFANDVQILAGDDLMFKDDDNTSFFRIGNISANTGSGDQNNTTLAIKNMQGTALINISGSGKVGIGTATPEEQLTVVGNIKAIGNIIAQNYIVSSSVTHMTQSFSSGSTIFGDTLTDTHQFTGSIFITGSGIQPGQMTFDGAENTIRAVHAAGTEGNLRIRPNAKLFLADAETNDTEIGRSDLDSYTTKLFDGSNTVALQVGPTGSVTFNVPVTASSNISASSFISASDLYLTNTLTALDGGVTVTSNANTELEVDGNITSSAYIMVTHSNNPHIGGFVLDRAGSDQYRLEHLDGGLTIVNTTNSSRKEMTFNGTGRVGIGTPSPTAQLHISSSNLGLRVENHTTPLNNGTKLAEFVHYDGTNNPQFQISSSANGILLQSTFTTGIPGEFRLRANGGSSYMAFDTGLVSDGSAGGEHMRLTSDGKLGIGTTNPISLLEVRGKVMVSGGLDQTRQIEIKTSGSGKSELILNTWRESANPPSFGTSRLFKTGSSTILSLDEDITIQNNQRTSFVINGSGDINFVSSSGTDNTTLTSYLFADASSSKIGIGGITNPQHELDITGSARIRGPFSQLRLINDANSANIELGMSSGDNFFFKRGDNIGNIFFRRQDNLDVLSVGMANQIVTVSGSLFVNIESGSGIGGHITASGDISASALLFASASDDGGTVGSIAVAMYDTASGRFYYTGSSALGDTTALTTSASKGIYFSASNGGTTIGLTNTASFLGTSNEVEVSISTNDITIGLPDSVTILTASVSNNLTVGGDLFVQGTTTTVNTDNLYVEDQFILLNSGSANDSTDVGIIAQTSSVQDQGSALYWDAGNGRWEIDGAGADAASNTATGDAAIVTIKTANSATPSDPYMGAVDAGIGQMYIDTGDNDGDGNTIYIYA